MNKLFLDSLQSYLKVFTFVHLRLSTLTLIGTNFKVIISKTDNKNKDVNKLTPNIVIKHPIFCTNFLKMINFFPIPLMDISNYRVAPPVN